MTDTIRIPLGPSGKPVAWTTVDLADYERLIVHRWYLAGRRYAFRTVSGRSVFMHREVLGFPKSEDIHHVNGDKLDNRRANLDACTHAHNVRQGNRCTVLPKREQIRALRLDGWTNKAIAAQLGLSEQSVVKYAGDLPRVPHPSRLWTRDELIARVQTFHAQHGRLPRGGDFDGGALPHAASIYRVFDGMPELRDAAGFGSVDLRRKVAA